MAGVGSFTPAVPSHSHSPSPVSWPGHRVHGWDCPFCAPQNIDTLERVAGLAAEDLVEAHGTFFTSHCLGTACRKQYNLDWMKGTAAAGVRGLAGSSSCLCPLMGPVAGGEVGISVQPGGFRAPVEEETADRPPEQVALRSPEELKALRFSWLLVSDLLVSHFLDLTGLISFVSCQRRSFPPWSPNVTSAITW